MATVTHAVSTASSLNTTSYTSGSFTPATGDLLIVCVIATATVASATLSNSQSITFTRHQTAARATSADTMYLFVANSLVTSGQAVSQTVTFDCTGDAATLAIIKVARVAGMSRTGSNAIRQTQTQNNIASGNTPAVTFGSACLTGNALLGFVGNGDATDPIATQPTNWTKLGNDTGDTNPATGLHGAYRNSGETGTTITWGSTVAGGQHCTICVELDTTAQSVTPDLLSAAGQVFSLGSISQGQSISSPALLTAAGQVFSPQVKQSASIPVVTVAGQVFSPQVNQSVSPGLLSSVAQIFAPTITQAGGTQTVGPVDLLSAAGQVFSPRVNQAAVMGLLNQSASTFSPQLNQAVSPGVLTQLAQVYNLQANQGVSPALITQLAQVFTPQVNLGVSPGRIENAGVVFSPTVTGGAQSVQPQGSSYWWM